MPIDIPGQGSLTVLPLTKTVKPTAVRKYNFKLELYVLIFFCCSLVILCYIHNQIGDVDDGLTTLQRLGNMRIGFNYVYIIPESNSSSTELQNALRRQQLRRINSSREVPYMGNVNESVVDQVRRERRIEARNYAARVENAAVRERINGSVVEQVRRERILESVVNILDNNRDMNNLHQ